MPDPYWKESFTGDWNCFFDLVVPTFRQRLLAAGKAMGIREDNQYEQHQRMTVFAFN
jgi:hypothetical protein